MRQSHYTDNGIFALSFLFSNTKKGGKAMSNKGNRFATNQGGVIKAPRPVTNSPKSTVEKGDDLRNGKKSK